MKTLVSSAYKIENNLSEALEKSFSYLVPFIQKFPEEIYMPPKPLAINHRAALSLFYR